MHRLFVGQVLSSELAHSVLCAPWVLCAFPVCASGGHAGGFTTEDAEITERGIFSTILSFSIAPRLRELSALQRNGDREASARTIFSIGKDQKTLRDRLFRFPKWICTLQSVFSVGKNQK